MIDLNFRKKMADSWFSYLQIQICKSFESLENNKLQFSKRDWQKSNIKEGGGTSYLMNNGKIFDKVGVNKSTVSGTFPRKFRSKILGAKKKGTYWASGVSVVAHMKNPKIPAIHFNTRFIVTSKEWFGGGMDATPSHKDPGESKMIHDSLKKICLQNKKNYTKYKKWCDEYFFLKHRNEARGIGGIFYDYQDGDGLLYRGKEKNSIASKQSQEIGTVDLSWENLYKLAENCGNAFLLAYQPIIEKRVQKNYSLI